MALPVEVPTWLYHPRFTPDATPHVVHPRRAQRNTRLPGRRLQRRPAPHQPRPGLLWGFITQAFGISYTNSATDPTGKTTYGWHFTYNANKGWITSGFSHSPDRPIRRQHPRPPGVHPEEPANRAGRRRLDARHRRPRHRTHLGNLDEYRRRRRVPAQHLLWFSTFPPAEQSRSSTAPTPSTPSCCSSSCSSTPATDWDLGRWWSARTPRLLN